MKKFLPFISGLIIPLIFYAIGGYLLFAMTFTLSSQILTEKENEITLFFYCVLGGIILIALIAFKQYKLKREYLSVGLAISTIPLMVILFKIGIIYFGQLNYYQPFDKTKWANNEFKPFNMAKTLSKKKELIGLDRKEVISKLGYFRETARFDGQTLIYNTENYWQFYIDLKKDTVIKAYLYNPGMD
jgi:hypothetical protein